MLNYLQEHCIDRLKKLEKKLKMIILLKSNKSLLMAYIMLKLCKLELKNVRYLTALTKSESHKKNLYLPLLQGFGMHGSDISHLKY